MLDPSSIHLAAEAVDSVTSGKRFISVNARRPQKSLLPRVRRNPVVHVAEVAQGCLSKCTSCQVKLARGGLVSFRPADVVREVEGAVADGCREIWLTSQDMSCYGRDIGTNLPELIRLICEVEGEFMVRVGMMNPIHLSGILDDLIVAYQHPKVFKFLHLPVQSGSNRILEVMERRYSAGEFEEICRKFRQEIPEVSLSTDVIVGFPSESDSDFRETVELIRRTCPDVVNISRFGARPRTKAAKMPQLSHNIVTKRSGLMHSVVKEIAEVRNRMWIGRQGPAIVDGNVRDAQVARNTAYKPVVIKSVLSIGSCIEVKVTDCTSNCLRGEVISRGLHGSEEIDLQSKRVVRAAIK